MKVILSVILFLSLTGCTSHNSYNYYSIGKTHSSAPTVSKEPESLGRTEGKNFSHYNVTIVKDNFRPISNPITVNIFKED